MALNEEACFIVTHRDFNLNITQFCCIFFWHLIECVLMGSRIINLQMEGSSGSPGPEEGMFFSSHKFIPGSKVGK